MRAAIESLDERNYAEKLAAAMQFVGWDRIVASQDRVFIKPNFTYPTYKPGVTTSPAIIEAAIQLLKTRTSNITIVESDGGGRIWTAGEAFRGHGLDDIAAKYGISLMNLSEHPSESAESIVAKRNVRVVLPSVLLHDCDVFITMPVPKVHTMTRVSLEFKNQWGCQPDVKRIRNHPDFDHKVLAINKLLKLRMAIFDGTYFLNRTGPMEGDAIKKDLIIVSNDIGAGSLVCCEIMRIDPWTVSHFRLARKEGMFPESLAQVELNCNLEPFKGEPFRLERTWLNWLALAAFRSHIGTKLVYDSVFADPIHKLLYLIRGRPEIGGYGERI